MNHLIDTLLNDPRALPASWERSLRSSQAAFVCVLASLACQRGGAAHACAIDDASFLLELAADGGDDALYDLAIDVCACAFN